MVVPLVPVVGSAVVFGTFPGVTEEESEAEAVIGENVEGPVVDAVSGTLAGTFDDGIAVELGMEAAGGLFEGTFVGPSDDTPVELRTGAVEGLFEEAIGAGAGTDIGTAEDASAA